MSCHSFYAQSQKPFSERFRVDSFTNAYLLTDYSLEDAFSGQAASFAPMPADNSPLNGHFVRGSASDSTDNHQYYPMPSSTPPPTYSEAFHEAGQVACNIRSAGKSIGECTAPPPFTYTQSVFNPFSIDSRVFLSVSSYGAKFSHLKMKAAIWLTIRGACSRHTKVGACSRAIPLKDLLAKGWLLCRLGPANGLILDDPFSLSPSLPLGLSLRAIFSILIEACLECPCVCP